MGFHRGRQVQPTALTVQKFCRPRGERSKEQRFFAIEDALVEVRYGHRWGSVQRLPINFRRVAFHNRGIITD